MSETADTWFDEALARARARVRERPLRAVGGAFVVGFVLGNGVPRSAGRLVSTIGLRMLINRVLCRGEGE